VKKHADFVPLDDSSDEILLPPLPCISFASDDTRKNDTTKICITILIFIAVSISSKDLMPPPAPLENIRNDRTNIVNNNTVESPPIQGKAYFYVLFHVITFFS
jgi:hypothetical protein